MRALLARELQAVVDGAERAAGPTGCRLGLVDQDPAVAPPGVLESSLRSVPGDAWPPKATVGWKMGASMTQPQPGSLNTASSANA
jgi:hypothetical protein